MASRDDARLLRAQASLTNRDLRLLEWLYDHGLLTTDQITIALFPSHDFGQRRLLRLTRLSVLTRFRPQRPTGGTFPYHYVLDQLGIEVVAAQRGDPLPRRSEARRQLHRLTSRARLPHLLGVNGFFTALAAYERQHPGASLDRWWPESAFQNRGAYSVANADVRVMLESRLPRPDGHGVFTDAGVSVPFFLEYDRGGESLTVLAEKIAGYEILAGYVRWRWPVLFWLPTARREMNLHNLLTSIDSRFKAVIATAAADFVTARALNPAEAVWWQLGRPGGRLRLTELPYEGDADLLDRPRKELR
ncbi:replication-relaxation family protein [Asanoa sp. NPDC049573]|uniref:replication-relaxation family protein n=1 Tax=Asanoa sp. NPDC049573 TaxID=3155396 RepID=UPI0034398ED5